MLPECCLKINLVYLGVEYFLDLTPVYNESGELIYYTIPLDSPVVNLVWVDGIWQLIDGNDETIYYTFESNVCPVSENEQWTSNLEIPLFDRFSIEWDGCPNALPVCCMLINIQFAGAWYSLPINPIYNESDELLYYEFTITYNSELGPTPINVVLGYANGIWYMLSYDNNVYYTFESTTCPSSSIEDWVCHEEAFFTDFEIINVACQQTVPECCLSMSAIFEGDTYTLDIVPFYSEGNSLLYYTMEFEYPAGEGTETINFNLYYYDGVWYMVDANTGFLYYSLNLAGCPGGTNDEWQEYTELFDAFVVFSLDCQNEPDEEEFIDIPEKPDLYYCKHKNLMRKVRAGLADRVADMKDIERFGLDKCMDKWEDIIKDYLIVHALQCAPYNEYTGLDEKCLIGKLTDKFNC